KEKKILTEQALAEGKPANIVEKMIEGRLQKGLKEICLNDQEFVKDSDFTVKSYVEKNLGKEAKVLRFVRFETGEGIEKKEENFAEEVAKAIQG
ncbi:MAG: elongation factor Ts, partial [Defluviitaleaceae bacterium]|nr:elongation factor Ts [Defluviitaleaceae bacterium]